ncbi:hypothetical protein ACQR0V_20225 [Bradyrhizobium sp. HKCCYLS2058]|uniref:hypothetical protein n=1 Tax=unclassified Bradyrhizobium TaxID=2631580 RepID=UPI0028F0E104|nr:hypothetical protein [Bradyrhizobium sp. SZCCHNS3002]
MSQTELLIVEQVFQLDGIGLAIVPDFSVPEAGWKNGSHRVRVVKPDGKHFDADANFHVVHFNIRDPSVPLDQRWRVVVSLPFLTRDSLPPGSRILGDRSLAAVLEPRAS